MNIPKRLAAIVALSILPLHATTAAGATPAPATLYIGSKRFTESYVLAEIAKQAASSAGEATVVHRQGLGNTAIVLNALQAGSIDLYPEYTGTIAREILKLDTVPSLTELNKKLAPMGLAASVPLGFNNTYALAMRGEVARERHIARLSDLKAHPTLRLGLSQEFIGRADGWPGLKAAYALPWTTPRGLDHGLAYEAVAQGQVDVIDIYSTDAKIGKYQLAVLIDDAHYFPRYDALLLHKADLPARFPKSWSAIAALEGRITDDAMRGMNATAELDKKSFEHVAAEFLASAASSSSSKSPGIKYSASAPPSSAGGFWQALFGPDL